MGSLVSVLFLVFLQATTSSSTVTPTARLSRQDSVDTAWTVIEGGLSEKAADRRAKATHALGLMQENAKAQEMAEKALSDANPDVRTQAAGALGAMNARSSIPKLKDALNDTQLKVVIAAANSLYIFKDPIAYDIYYAILTGERKGPGLLQSQMSTLRDRKQMEKLAFETGIGFIPFAGAGYEAYKAITHDDSSPIRADAAEKLLSDPDPKTTDALSRACSDKQWRVRMAVVETIAKRGNPDLLSSLGPLLFDSNDDVRYETAAAVIRLSTKKPTRVKPHPKTS